MPATSTIDGIITMSIVPTMAEVSDAAEDTANPMASGAKGRGFESGIAHFFFYPL